LPIRKPREKKKQSPLLRRYLDALGEPVSTIARKAGVGRGRMHDAVNHGVGLDNASKIAAYFGRVLDLSEREELELRAELMGTPDNLVRAYLGSVPRAAYVLGIDEANATKLLEPEGSISYAAGLQAQAALREMNAPEHVRRSVEERTLLSPEHGQGAKPKVEYSDPAARNALKGPTRKVAETKPRLDAAIRESGMSLPELAERAGVGRETLRQARHDRCGGDRAVRIARTLGERLKLSEEQMALLVWEMVQKIPRRRV
jgi:hypothetical protein